MNRDVLLLSGEAADVSRVLQDRWPDLHHDHHLPLCVPAGCLIGLQLLAEPVGRWANCQRHAERPRAETECVCSSRVHSGWVKSHHKSTGSVIKFPIKTSVWPHYFYFRDGHVRDDARHSSGWYCSVTSPSCWSSQQCPLLTNVLLWGHAQRKPPEPILQRDRCHRLHDSWRAEDDAGLPVQTAGNLHNFVVGHTLHRAGAPPPHLCLHLNTGNRFTWILSLKLSWSLVGNDHCPWVWSPEFLRGVIMSAATSGGRQPLPDL